MRKHTIKQVKMTSTELFRIQAANIYSMLRHENSEAETDFIPTHLGGLQGQVGILRSKSVMRQTRVS